MKRYSDEGKEAALKKLLPPTNMAFGYDFEVASMEREWLYAVETTPDVFYEFVLTGNEYRQASILHLVRLSCAGEPLINSAMPQQAWRARLCTTRSTT